MVLVTNIRATDLKIRALEGEIERLFVMLDNIPDFSCKSSLAFLNPCV